MGRKTFTYQTDTRNSSDVSFERRQRNLREELGGLICSECQSGSRAWARGGPSSVATDQSSIASGQDRCLAAGGARAHPAAAALVTLAVCTSGTIGECKTNLIFGLPAQHWCYVEYVRKG